MLHLPDELEKKRSDFLKRLYELSDGAETKFINMWEIGDQLGFDRDLTISIAQYLKGEGLTSQQQEKITNSFPKENTVQQFWSEIDNRNFWKYYE